MKNKVTGHTRGFGFVRFYGMSDVYRALSLPESELPTYTDRVTGKVYDASYDDLSCFVNQHHHYQQASLCR